MSLAVINGRVLHGKKRGKDLGFPTANIQLEQPIEEGIYVSYVTINEKLNTYSSSDQAQLGSREVNTNSSRQARTIRYPSLTFIGPAKTFEETQSFAETYILDFDQNIYEKEITVELLQKIRDNQKFENEEQLIEQMKKDEVLARNYFHNN